MPSPAALREAIAELSARIAVQGVWNMLLSDSRSLYCYRSTHLAVLTRRAPFGAATLIDEDLTVDFSKETSMSDVVTIVATRPLTRNEDWFEITKGSLAVFRDGEMIAGALQRHVPGRPQPRASVHA